jgi:hypothetical protein
VNARAMANFCGMFGLVHETGIDVVQALTMAAYTIPNGRIARGVAASIPEVAQGGSISGALERTGAFPSSYFAPRAPSRTRHHSGRLGHAAETCMSHVPRFPRLRPAGRHSRRIDSSGWFGRIYRTHGGRSVATAQLLSSRTCASSMLSVSPLDARYP